MVQALPLLATSLSLSDSISLGERSPVSLLHAVSHICGFMQEIFLNGCRMKEMSKFDSFKTEF